MSVNQMLSDATLGALDDDARRILTSLAVKRGRGGELRVVTVGDVASLNGQDLAKVNPHLDDDDRREVRAILSAQRVGTQSRFRHEHVSV